MGSRLEVLWIKKEVSINNLRLENAEDFPFLLSEIVEKNHILLNNMCGMVEDGTFVLSGTPKRLTLNTPLNTEHTYSLDSELKFTLVSQRAFPLSIAELKANTKKK